MANAASSSRGSGRGSATSMFKHKTIRANEENSPTLLEDIQNEFHHFSNVGSVVVLQFLPTWAFIDLIVIKQLLSDHSVPGVSAGILWITAFISTKVISGSAQYGASKLKGKRGVVANLIGTAIDITLFPILCLLLGNDVRTVSVFTPLIGTFTATFSTYIGCPAHVQGEIKLIVYSALMGMVLVGSSFLILAYLPLLDKLQDDVLMEFFIFGMLFPCFNSFNQRFAFPDVTSRVIQIFGFDDTETEQIVFLALACLKIATNMPIMVVYFLIQSNTSFYVSVVASFALEIPPLLVSIYILEKNLTLESAISSLRSNLSYISGKIQPISGEEPPPKTEPPPSDVKTPQLSNSARRKKGIEDLCSMLGTEEFGETISIFAGAIFVTSHLYNWDILHQDYPILIWRCLYVVFAEIAVNVIKKRVAAIFKVYVSNYYFKPNSFSYKLCLATVCITGGVSVTAGNILYQNWDS